MKLVQNAARATAPIVALLLGGVVLTPSAYAQWAVVNLYPPGATDGAYGLGVQGGQQVGWAGFGGFTRASLWTGSSASWVDLTPVDSFGAYAWGGADGQQVGQVGVLPFGYAHASIWSGTASSWRDLHPANAIQSSAFGGGLNQQVGYVTLPNTSGGPSASLWSGSPESWVNLNPPGCDDSIAYGVREGVQVGYACGRASLWRGTASSRVDLNPIGSTSSIAFAVQGDTQVGEAFVGGIYRASLWRGTAASWVDLNPQGAIESHAVALDAGSQAGWADFGSNPRAGVWSGTAASWIDLHAVLSQDFVLSKATGIWSDATHTYVVGWGTNTVTNRNEPLLWVGPALGPCDFDVGVVASRTVCPNRPASFTVTVSPPGPFTYQWRFNGVPIEIQANSTARSATLRIRYALPVNVGIYDCVVTDSCRSVTSNAAELVVCSADFNCDGFLDFFDYDEFVTAFETGGGLEADFNRDGFVDFFDYDDFVLAYETGC